MEQVDVTKIRVVAEPEIIQVIGETIQAALAGIDWQVIEFSRAYPCSAPEIGQSRMYLTAIRNQEKSDV